MRAKRVAPTVNMTRYRFAGAELKSCKRHAKPMGESLVKANMKSILLICLALASIGAVAQEAPKRSREPFRIRVRHADPWFVKAMLEGVAVSQPELSSIPGFQGIGQAATNGVRGLLSGGKLIVNPTDNSLWFYPDP